MLLIISKSAFKKTTALLLLLQVMAQSYKENIKKNERTH